MDRSVINSRIGLMFFAFYLFIYTAFVFVSAFAPSLLEHQLAGVSLAVMSGFGLIAGAMILAVLYCWLCRERTA